MREQKEVKIPIEVDADRIKLKRNHAVTLYSDETITWTCPYRFSVQFPPGAPFEAVNSGEVSTLKRVGKAIPHFPYKYTIAVHDGRKVLILDPVLVDVPPEN